MKNLAKIPDPVISQKVSEQLANRGMRAPCHVTVVTNHGNVTLIGAIQYEHQRRIAIHAISAIAGVRGVVDQMKVIPQTQHWKISPSGDK